MTPFFVVVYKLQDLVARVGTILSVSGSVNILMEGPPPEVGWVWHREPFISESSLDNLIHIFQNLVLIAQGDHSPSHLTPYFLVLPSPSTHSLLVKSIAPGELLLPADAQQQPPLEEQPGETARRTVENALGRVRKCLHIKLISCIASLHS